MIVIQVGDQHLDTIAPRSRKDNYYEAIQNKLLEVRALANTAEEKGQVVRTIFVGDLINRQHGHLVHYRLVNWCIDYFRAFKTKPFLILGNHDILSRSDSWMRQPIGAIIKADVVQPLWEGDVLRVQEGDLTVAFTGTPYYYDIDKDRKGYNIPRVPHCDYHIHTVHGALLPEGTSYFGDYTWPSQITFGGDLILCGHMHECFGVYGPPDGRFVVTNFGAIARGSVASFNLNRDAQVGWFELTKQSDKVQVKIDKRLLTCAKPVDEVFYLEEITRKKLQKEEMAKLADTFQEQAETGFELINPIVLMESYLERRNLTSRTKQLVREYVNKAGEELA